MALEHGLEGLAADAAEAIDADAGGHERGAPLLLGRRSGGGLRPRRIGGVVDAVVDDRQRADQGHVVAVRGRLDADARVPGREGAPVDARGARPRTGAADAAMPPPITITSGSSRLTRMRDRAPRAAHARSSSATQAASPSVRGAGDELRVELAPPLAARRPRGESVAGSQCARLPCKGGARRDGLHVAEAAISRRSGRRARGSGGRPRRRCRRARSAGGRRG